MQEIRRRMEFFSLYDHTGIEKHLEKLAEKGWLLEKITPLYWVYRRTEPRKVRFAVTYFPDASEFDPEPREEQLIYQDYGARQGWTFVCRSAQMQIFCNGEEDPVPMETDPAAQVETVHRAAKRGFLPCYICILILSCFAWRLTGMAGIAWKLLLFLSAYELFGYYRWRHDARRAAESGRFLDTPGSMRVQKAVTAASGILLVCTLIFTRSEMRLTAYTLTLVGLFLVMAAVNAVKLLLKRLRVPRAVNFAVTMLLAVVFAVALTTGVLWVCRHFFVSKVMPFR